jgi:hypothetical protein
LSGLKGSYLARTKRTDITEDDAKKIFSQQVSSIQTSYDFDKILAERNLFRDIGLWFKDLMGTFKTHTPEHPYNAYVPMDIMHTGGIAKSTGPKFIEKGEVILPKSYAEGGVVASPLVDLAKPGATKFLNGKTELDSSEFKSAIDDFETIVNKLEEVTKDVKLTVDTSVAVPIDVGDAVVPVDITNVSVPVDVTGVSIPIDTTGVTVSVDAADAASRISAAIATATAGLGGTVGAERIDILAETVKAVDDRLISVKDNVDTMVFDTTEKLNSVKSSIEDRMNNIEVEVRRHVSELRSQNADVVSSVSNVSHKYESYITSLTDSLNKITSLTMSNL